MVKKKLWEYLTKCTNAISTENYPINYKLLSYIKFLRL